MDFIVVRLILCGVLICGILSCTAIKELTTVPPREQKVVEEDVSDEVKRPGRGTSSQTPRVTDGPPAPQVEQPLPPVPPAERPPRHIKWHGDGWSPGDPEKDGTRP